MYNTAVTATASGIGAAAGATTIAQKLGVGDPVTSVVGGLAFTGLDVVYIICGAFALIAAGMALLRIAPRRRVR